MSYETITLEKDSGVATLNLNRPDVLNAINNQMRLDLLQAIDEVANDDNVGVLLIIGKGRAFCAGGDVKSMGGGKKERMISPHPILKKIVDLEKVVIAAVNGVAAGGGCNLALAADIIIASEEASFIQSFARIGLVPDWGGMYFLPRRVGIAKAKELMFSGDKISAREAADLGMVNHVVPVAEFNSFVSDYAARLTKGPPLALLLMKRILNVSLGMEFDALLTLEQQAQTVCRESEDHREGLRAFKEKRAPLFTGK